MPQLPAQARALLKSVFGYDDFRPGQAEIIAAVLSGAPVLAIMPTAWRLRLDGERRGHSVRARGDRAAPRSVNAARASYRQGRASEKARREHGARACPLKRKRLELARAEGVPAYVVFHDRTLIDMAERRPANLDAMRDIHGVGERKLARYGDAFLEALAGADG